MTKWRSAPLPKEQWELMRSRIKQTFIDERKTHEETVVDVYEQFGRQITKRQLKEQCRKWRYFKKIPCYIYHAMLSVMNANGSHISFTVQTAEDGNKVYRDAKQIKKQIDREKDVQKYEALVEQFRPQKIALSFLRDANVVIEGLGDNPYGNLQSDSDESDAPSEDSDENLLSDIDDWVREPSPIRSNSRRRPGGSDCMVYTIESKNSAFSQWVAHELADISWHQNSKYASRDGDWKPMADGSYFKEPQHGRVDDMSKLFSRLALSLPEDDSSRTLYETFLGYTAGTVKAHFDWDKRTDKLIVEFSSYYVLQCLSEYADLDEFDHPDRIETRRQLTELFRTRTGELLQVLWWLMTLLSTHRKSQQQEGLFEDIVDCISNSNDEYAQALRPIFDVARVVNADYIETRYTSQPYQLPQPNPKLECEFRDNIQYLRRIKMDRTGDFAIMHMFLAWYLITVGRPTECMIVILGADGLPLAEKVLGTYHLVVLNYKALAAVCYSRMGNGLAGHHISEAILGLDGCSKPLEPFKYILKRQQAMISFDEKRRSDGFKILKEVLDFNFRTFGVRTDAVWSVVNEIGKIACGHEEEQNARQIEQEFLTHLAMSSASR